MKMNIKWIKILLLTLSLNVLVNCRGQTEMSDLEKQFSAKIPITDMNNSLRVVVDANAQYFPLSSDIDLVIENRSSRSISFDPKAHIRLLKNIGSQWVDVENAISYSGTFILPPEDSGLMNWQNSRVEPVLDTTSITSDDTLIPLRIVIIGEFIRGDQPTGKQVAAYVDVFIKPVVEANPPERITYATVVGVQVHVGKIEGTITSNTGIGEPLANVTVSLVYHPFFNENNRMESIATTITDSQGKYSFDDVEPGIYALHTTIFLEQGSSCDSFDLSKIINVEAGTVATVNIGLDCTP